MNPTTISWPRPPRARSTAWTTRSDTPPGTLLTLDPALARYGPEAPGIRGNQKLAVASAVFLVLEMDGPFHGLITVSPEPLAFALVHMNR